MFHFRSFRCLLTAVLVSLGCQLPLVFGADAREVLQTFTLTEHFGASHPSQIVDFDLKQPVDPARVHVRDAKVQPVLFQVLEGGKKLAVQTDLSAGESRQWQLRSGPSPKELQSALQVTDVPEQPYLQITNGLTGIRIPRPVKPEDAKMSGQGFKARLQLPAPVQGVLYCDGRWTAQGPNVLQVWADALTAMQLRFRERGPLKVVVEFAYEVRHGEYRYGPKTIIKPAGPGYYHSTITVQADQPSVLFEEDTDVDVSWSMNLYDGLEPTHARFRGHSASKKEYGYEPDGRIYRSPEVRPSLDAQVDLQFDRPMVPSNVRSPNTWKRIDAWNPWCYDGGWYYQLFNAKAGDRANLAGIFAGRASLAIEPAATGVGIFTGPPPQGGKTPQAGITFSSQRTAAMVSRGSSQPAFIGACSSAPERIWLHPIKSSPSTAR